MDSGCGGSADMVEIAMISNPILFIIIGGIAGYLWLRRQERRLSMARIEREEKEEGL